MVDFDDLDIPIVGPEHARGALDQVGQHRNSKRCVGRNENWHDGRRVGDQLVMALGQAGRPDQDWNAGAHRLIEARPKPVGGGEVDQHVAMVIVDNDVIRGFDRGSDRPPHSAPRGVKRQAERLLVGAHGAVMAQCRCARNCGAPALPKISA